MHKNKYENETEEETYHMGIGKNGSKLLFILLFIYTTVNNLRLSDSAERADTV